MDFNRLRFEVALLGLRQHRYDDFCFTKGLKLKLGRKRLWLKRRNENAQIINQLLVTV
jgi:hypothetical protein